MSCQELKTYRWKCDTCSKVRIVQTPDRTLPTGWEYFSVYGCGLTGYTKRLERCGFCKYQANGKEKTNGNNDRKPSSEIDISYEE